MAAPRNLWRLLFALSLSGCLSSGDLTECSVDGDCAQGEVCLAQVCVPSRGWDALGARVNDRGTQGGDAPLEPSNDVDVERDAAENPDVLVERDVVERPDVIIDRDVVEPSDVFVERDVAEPPDIFIDGYTDSRVVCNEGLTDLCTSVCGTGIRTCEGGRWSPCDAPQPTPEVCDGIDNDCDNHIDELDELEEIGGECQYQDEEGGVTLLGIYLSCERGSLLCGIPECGLLDFCDYIDNNCNGIVDDIQINQPSLLFAEPSEIPGQIKAKITDSGVKYIYFDTNDNNHVPQSINFTRITQNLDTAIYLIPGHSPSFASLANLNALIFQLNSNINIQFGHDEQVEHERLSSEIHRVGSIGVNHWSAFPVVISLISGNLPSFRAFWIKEPVQGNSDLLTAKLEFVGVISDNAVFSEEQALVSIPIGQFGGNSIATGMTGVSHQSGNFAVAVTKITQGSKSLLIYFGYDEIGGDSNLIEGGPAVIEGGDNPTIFPLNREGNIYRYRFFYINNGTRISKIDYAVDISNANFSRIVGSNIDLIELDSPIESFQVGRRTEGPFNQTLYDIIWVDEGANGGSLLKYALFAQEDRGPDGVQLIESRTITPNAFSPIQPGVSANGAVPSIFFKSDNVIFTLEGPFVCEPHMFPGFIDPPD